MLALREVAIKYIENQKYPLLFTGEGVSPVKAGDRVDPSTVIFEGSETSILQSIDLSKELAIQPEKASSYILKSDGEIVDAGDVIAKRTVSLGIIERVVRSMQEGRISLQRIDKGVVDIMAPFSESIVTAGMHGQVAHIMPGNSLDREIILSVEGLVIAAEIYSGDSISGPLHLIKDGNSIYRASDVDSSCHRKIVVCGRYLNIPLYEALVEAGALGIITGGVGIEDFNMIKDKAVPVFVMGGWGIIPLSNVLHSCFTKYKDSPVFMDMRNGNLFIYPAIDAKELSSNRYNGKLQYLMYGEACELIDLREGQKVQIWDAPFWGYSGVVLDVLDDEGLVNIELESGRKALVEPELVRIIE